MLEFNINTDGLARMERALLALSEKQIPFAASQALNDCTKAASVAVNKAMPEIFDRPTNFTDRAAVAPRALAATKARLVSTVTLRPIQAQYLAPEDAGGERTPGMNTRKPGAAALILPGKGLQLDQFGNIPDGTLRLLKQQAAAEQGRRRKRQRQKKANGPAAAPPAAVDQSNTVVFLDKNAVANKAGIGGYFRRLTGGHLTRLTAFEPETHYKPRFGYHALVEKVAIGTWAPAMLRRLQAAITSAR
jgi:hypothetical protein